MGLAASQGRLLMLTARKSDTELRAQQISQQRLILANQTEDLAREYADKVNNRCLMFRDPLNEGKLGKLMYTDITGILNCRIVDADGNILVQRKSTDIESNETGLDLKDPIHLEFGLRNGLLFMERENLDNIDAEGTAIWEKQVLDGISQITDEYDTSDDAAAEAKYNLAKVKIQNKDKRLELDLKQVETQHKALETEIESVQKVITKNIEMSFKTFS